MVLGSLDDEDALLDLTAIQVSAGRCSGRPASEYLQGHVDKGCFEVIESALANRNGDVPGEHQVPIELVAKVIEPFAVLLR
jgi:hypothetical protein